MMFASDDKPSYLTHSVNIDGSPLNGQAYGELAHGRSIGNCVSQRFERVVKQLSNQSFGH